ncbi:MAG: DALR domain-containing protein, partial [Anaerococcus vaginalis]
GYRLPINFTREIIEQAKNSLERLNNAKFRMDDLLGKASGNLKDEEKDLVKELDNFENNFRKVMDDDLNTADALTVLFEISKFANTKLDEKSSKEFLEKTRDLFIKLEDVLGIENRKKTDDSLDENLINKLIEERKEAKKAKDFAKADEIRDKLSEMGILIKDTREGTKWELK